MITISLEMTTLVIFILYIIDIDLMLMLYSFSVGGCMSTLEKVKKLIAEQLCISTDDISDDANIMEDLGADSLDVVEMLMTLEDEFGLSIPDEKVDDIKTVPAIVKMIDENMK